MIYLRITRKEQKIRGTLCRLASVVNVMLKLSNLMFNQGTQLAKAGGPNENKLNQKLNTKNKEGKIIYYNKEIWNYITVLRLVLKICDDFTSLILGSKSLNSFMA